MSAESSPQCLALDVGGANVKAAHSSGECRSFRFALWREPKALPDVLRRVAAAFPESGRVVLTMTAELCDCFATKTEGVLYVLYATLKVFGERKLSVLGTDSLFHSVPYVIQTPKIAAAGNWLALAEVAARLVPEGPAMLIDVGSTTTDLIPLRDGRPVPRGRNDTDRLRSGELVYAAVRRTPICALATSLPWRGGPIGLAAELFATTLDVYLTLRDLPEDVHDRETADGLFATIERARSRLARMVGADRDEFSDGDAREFAQAADRVLMDRLVSSAEAAWRGAEIQRPTSVVIAGSGEFLAQRVAGRVATSGGRVVRLSEEWGPAASSAGCAKALLILAENQEDQ